MADQEADQETDQEETQKAPVKKKSKRVRVKAAIANKAFHEQHKDHPKGEIFVKGPNVFTVGNTSKVKDAIVRGVLVKA